MYTSGSTGTPKGVVLPHEALVTTVKGFFFVVNPTRPGDIYLGYLPLAHISDSSSKMWKRGRYPKEMSPGLVGFTTKKKALDCCDQSFMWQSNSFGCSCGTTCVHNNG